ncbi:MAG: dTDP-4-dehydrorhamnose reductase [Planctomycetes bacterium]|nr:dTDP-4-dehydrorhamnose reductase [Planctomycetota bacterium]
MRVLLLGASGQVGHELARALPSLGEVEVVAPRRTANDAWPRAVDLTEPDSLRACVREVRPNLIINAAAYTAVDRAEAEPELAMAVNGLAPGVLAEEARRLGAALLHYSTDYVFDGSGERPWREDDPSAPFSAYGRTKLAGEEAIRAAQASHLILRVSWVYGVHGNNFVKTMLRLGRERSRLAVVDDQIGAPTSAQAIAQATVEILAGAGGDLARFFDRAGGVLHFACAGETSWHGFAQEIFRLARACGARLAVQDVAAIPTREYPTPARRPLNSRLDCRRWRERVGSAPPEWRTELNACLRELLRPEHINLDVS